MTKNPSQTEVGLNPPPPLHHLPLASPSPPPPPPPPQDYPQAKTLQRKGIAVVLQYANRWWVLNIYRDLLRFIKDEFLIRSLVLLPVLVKNGRLN